MKRFMRFPFKIVWRAAHPVRHRVIHRLGELVRQNAVQPAPHVHLVCEVPESTNLLMDHMVREMVRLQLQVERLQNTLEDLLPQATGFTLLRSHDVDREDVRSAG
jgi:hypothetical protein